MPDAPASTQQSLPAWFPSLHVVAAWFPFGFIGPTHLYLVWTGSYHPVDADGWDPELMPEWWSMQIMWCLLGILLTITLWSGRETASRLTRIRWAICFQIVALFAIPTIVILGGMLIRQFV